MTEFTGPSIEDYYELNKILIYVEQYDSEVVLGQKDLAPLPSFSLNSHVSISQYQDSKAKYSQNRRANTLL